MKILQMSTESTVQVAFVLPVAQHLRKQGHHVTLACSDDPGEAGRSFVESLRQEGFDVQVLPISRRISLFRDLLAILKTYQFLRQRRFDVVHVQTAKAGMIGRIAARLAGVPVIVYTAHAFPFHERLNPWRVHAYALLERIASRLCNAIVVDSECVMARGLAYKVTAPDHIRVIPMGIDTERFDPDKYRSMQGSIRAELGLRPRATVIGAVARLVPDKGFDCLLETVALLAKRFPDVQCLIVGDGPLREDLRLLAKRLNVDDHIVFAGHRTDIPRVLAVMDIYMLPTGREGFGVAIAEAMSMGVPVIVSRIPPITEIVVDGQTGSLAEVGNPESFARAAVPLLEHPGLRRQMGQAGRRHVIERFEQGVMCQAYERLFLEYHEGQA